MITHRLYDFTGMVIIIASLILWLASWAVDSSGIYWLIGAALAGVLLRFSLIGLYVAATLGHVSLALVALSLAYILDLQGYSLPLTSIAAKGVYLSLSLIFYLSLMGVVRFDAYGWFYALRPRLALVLVLLAYVLVTGDVFVGLVACLGYGLTLLRIGGTNILDHLHHFLIPLIVIIGLFAQA